MTKEINLTQGKTTIVDDWWFDELNQYRWQASFCPSTNSFYVTRAPSVSEKASLRHIRMGRFIMGAKEGFHVDHINGDTLDNREENLRICTQAQNNLNRKMRQGNKSGYKGVSPYRNRWIAQIQVNGMKKHIGVYSTPEDAARAYDSVARNLHGQYARVNFS